MLCAPKLWAPKLWAPMLWPLKSLGVFCEAMLGMVYCELIVDWLDGSRL